MFTENIVKDAYPFEVVCLDDCWIQIKNGAAGTFLVKKQFLAVDGCDGGEHGIFCVGGDQKDYIVVFDASKFRTGFNPAGVSLYPKDFGFSTKEELIAHLCEKAGREVTLDCCINDGLLHYKDGVICEAPVNTTYAARVMESEETGKDDGNDGGGAELPSIEEICAACAEGAEYLCNTEFTEGSVIYQGADGCLKEDNPNFYYDEEQNILTNIRDSYNAYYNNLANYGNLDFTGALIWGNDTGNFPNGLTALHGRTLTQMSVNNGSYTANVFRQMAAGGGTLGTGYTPLPSSTDMYATNAFVAENVFDTYSAGSYNRFTRLAGMKAVKRGEFADGKAYGGLAFYTTMPDNLWFSSSFHVFTLEPDGSIKMDQYGSGGFSGVPTFDLAIDASGNVLEIPSGAIPSDSSIKENVEDFDAGMLSQLTPKKYDKRVPASKTVTVTNQEEIDAYIEENGEEGAPVPVVHEEIEYELKAEYGFLAEDVAEVMPEAVKQTGDISSVQYWQMIPMLVKELQASNARIAELESRVADLEQPKK